MPPRNIHNINERCAWIPGELQSRAASRKALGARPPLAHSPPLPLIPPGCRGAADWYWALPPITRSLLTCYLVTGLAAFVGVLPLQHLYHSWGLVFKLWVPQVRTAGGVARQQ